MVAAERLELPREMEVHIAELWPCPAGIQATT